MQVPIDSWPKAADRMLEIAGLLLAASHVVFLVLIVLWFALRKPGSLRLFGARLRAASRGRPMPLEVPGPLYETRVYAATGPDLPPRGSVERKAMISRMAARKNGDPGR